MAPKKIDQMLDLGIDHLFVSVNTLNPEKYRSVMGIPLKRTLDNLAYLTDSTRKHRVAKKITFRMTRLGDTTLEEQDDFIRYCKARGVKHFIVGLFNYKGDVNSSCRYPDTAASTSTASTSSRAVASRSAAWIRMARTAGATRTSTRSSNCIGTPPRGSIATSTLRAGAGRSSHAARAICSGR